MIGSAVLVRASGRREETSKARLIKMCPYLYQTHPIMKDRPAVNPLAVEECGILDNDEDNNDVYFAGPVI
jgi:hypothetical protein